MAKGRLGKGLGALLPDENEGQNGDSGPANEGERGSGGAAGTGGALKAPGKGGECLIPIEKISVNPNQPRKHFDDASLEELAASIKQHGIIQPVIVEEAGGGYVIIAGERRSRAAKLAGLGEIPAIIRNYSSQKKLEVALIENIHREDLNPIEEAAAYKRIMETGGLSQDETAARVGKNRSTVANALRLLKLPEHMRKSLEDGSLSAGHARAILSLNKAADQEKLYREIAGKGLSVRAAEKMAAALSGAAGVPAGKAGSAASPGSAGATRDPQLKSMEDKLIEKMGTKVSINGSLKKGRVEIEYYSMDDLDRIYNLLD
jgi:ParB family chromosome partitioning protein